MITPDSDWFEEIVNSCEYETRLAIAAWVFKHITAQAQQGGSFRYLIYNRLGFDSDAYVPLYDAGGMEISNSLFDADKINKIIEIVQEHRLEPLKRALGLCDEPNCFKTASCGMPTDGEYRLTCLDHNNHHIKKGETHDE
jgi:hypothetical protein